MKLKQVVTTLIASAAFFSSVAVSEQTDAAKVTPTATVISDAQATQKLMMAYRREFVFLDQEVRALKERKIELDSLFVEKKSKSNVDIAALEEKLLSLRDQIDTKMDLMTKKEEVIDEAASNADLVDVALTQMIVSLERYKIGQEIDLDKMQDGAQKLEAVGGLFDDAFAVLDTINNNKVQDGEFYDMNGSLQKGKVVTIGQNMAYGVSDTTGGVLAPAGGGKYMLWDGSGLETAKNLVAGQELTSAYSAYLYEDINKKATRVEEKSFEDFLEDGGIIGVVILVLGAVALLLILIRTLLLVTASSNSKILVLKVGEFIKSGSKEEAQSFLAKKSGASARVLEATVKHLHYKPSMLEDVISESVLHETPRLEKFESAITVVAAVAPLLGLLGTVTGMISTFDIITIHGTGDPKMLSGGISEALVTTMMGLTVAIPLLLIGNLLSSWSEKIMSNIEHSALSVTNISRSE
jgi:biopolymer transport protein ExbB